MMGMTDVRCGPKLNRRKLTEYQDTRAGVLRLWFWLRNLSVMHLTPVRQFSAERGVCSASQNQWQHPSPSLSIEPVPKSCGQLLGESWPRAIRSGTGRGGDVTGSRVSSCSCLLSAIARAGSGDCRPVVAQRNPHVGIAL